MCRPPSPQEPLWGGQTYLMEGGAGSWEVVLPQVTPAGQRQLWDLAVPQTGAQGLPTPACLHPGGNPGSWVAAR